MIPGCKVFWQGAVFGIMFLSSLLYAARGDWPDFIVTAGVGVGALWFGLSNAFRLLCMEPRQ